MSGDSYVSAFITFKYATLKDSLQKQIDLLCDLYKRKTDEGFVELHRTALSNPSSSGDDNA